MLQALFAALLFASDAVASGSASPVPPPPPTVDFAALPATAGSPSPEARHL